MATRRSDPTRGTQTPARTPTSPPGHVPGSSPTQTAAKAPAKSSTKAAPRRAQPVQADPTAQTAAVSDDQRRGMIAEAAYFHAEQRGFAPGGEVEDWLAAEAEVDALLAHFNGMRQ